MEFDALNTLDKPYKKRAIPYDEYFVDMDLDDEQIESRMSFSRDTEDMLLFIFALLSVMRDYGVEDFEYLKSELKARYLIIIGEYADIDDYLSWYASDFSDSFIDTTVKNIDIEWFLSDDRAMFDAENEANNVLNYSEFVKAILNGKTKKQWVSFGDKRVRKTHRAVDGKIIPITDYFQVGKALMRFAKDYQLANGHPEELISCRCTVKYL